MSLLIVVGQSIAIYVFLVVLLARVGRSLMSGLTHANYLVVALLGSAVETGLYHGSDALSAGVVSATTLIAADRVTCWMMNRWPRLRRLLAGGPVVLVHDGRFLHAHLRALRLSEADVRTGMRKRGYDDPQQIHLAVMEPNGEIGVVPKHAS
jgi:uncharacterized membrane protein YcaP (DUF421 family)